MGTGGTPPGTGSGGVDACANGPVITSCSPDAVTPPTPADESSPCTVEGARCSGIRCFDWGNTQFVTTCCAGQWRVGFGGHCPGPGDPFPCTGNLSCAIGQSYCLSANADRSDSIVSSCQPSCAAGDCSCFCDGAEGCTFKPPGSTCPADICRCRTEVAGTNFAVPGAIAMSCEYLIPGSGRCYADPSVDARCGGLRYAMLCTGGTDGLPDGCTPLANAGSTASCGGPLDYYCCDN
jgi:hypothetical protein